MQQNAQDILVEMSNYLAIQFVFGMISRLGSSVIWKQIIK